MKTEHNYLFVLLNRLAWFVSLMPAISFLILSMEDGDFFGFFILSLFLGLFIKGVFFGSDFISKSCEQITGLSIDDQTLDNHVSADYVLPVNVQPSEVKLKKSPTFSQEPTKIEQVDSLKTEQIKDAEKLEKSSIFKLDILGYIKDFFSTNLLAKVGGILVFAGVLFFLSLIYSSLNLVGKFAIGIGLGMLVFIIGNILNNKGIKNEGRIVMGVGLMINYLVILGGRYLLKDAGEFLLSPLTTLIYLIANTIIAVITGLTYKSGPMLIFAFLIAYLNPLLVGGDSTSPYILLAYASIISIGVIIVSLFKSQQEIVSKRLLLAMAFLGLNILTYLAPFSDSLGWITKLLVSCLFSIGIILILYKNKQTKDFLGYMLFTYLFLGLGIYDGSATLVGAFADITIYLLNMFFIGGLFFVTVYFIINGLLKKHLRILFVPLFFVLYLFSIVFYQGGESIFWFLLPSIYVLLFMLAGIFFYILPFMGGILGGIFTLVYLVITGFIMAQGVFDTNIILNNLEFWLLSGSFLLFYITTILVSKNKSVSYISLIALIGTFLLVSPLLTLDDGYAFRSIAFLLVLFIINLAKPFMNSFLRLSAPNIIIISTYLGFVYFLIQILRIGNDFQWVIADKGLAVSTLGLLYLLFSFVYKFITKTDLQSQDKENKTNSLIVFNYFSTFMIASLLGLIIALDNNATIIPYVVFFQSLCYFFIYKYYKNYLLYMFGIIFMLVGAGFLFRYLGSEPTVFWSGFSMMVFVLSLIIGIVYLLQGVDSKYKNFSIGINLLLLMFISILVGEIFHIEGGVIGIGIYLLVLNIGLIKNQSKSLNLLVLLMFAFGFLYHIGFVDENGNTTLWSLPLIISLASTLYVTLFSKNFSQTGHKNVYLLIYLLYFFIVTSMLLHNYNSDNFVLSMYRGVYACGFLIGGISYDKKALRTVGLYFLTITVLKLGLYDIIQSETSTVTKVMAFMILGFVLIGISIYYSKKYGNNLKGEWNLSNLGLVGAKKGNDSQQNFSDINLGKIYIDDILGRGLGNVESIEFILQDNTALTSHDENIIKIGKFIVENAKKNYFQPNELGIVYDVFRKKMENKYAIDNIQEFDKYLSGFVKQGGIINLKHSN
ncbi:MAG: DUF2339 domain-containing protein [Candidatus Absconditabacteria bacterium]